MIGRTLIVSQNEIKFVVTRAAVGVGVPFGVAEDFAATVIWAARCGLDPAAASISCLGVLELFPQRSRVRLTDNGEMWQFDGVDGLSAAYGGLAISDFWQLPDCQGRIIKVLDVDHPLLATAAFRVVGTISAIVEWDNVRVDFGGNGAVKILASDRAAVLSTAPSDITVRRHTAPPEWSIGYQMTTADLDDGARKAAEEGISVDAGAWARLTELFRRCLVPSSEQSRRAGAGAGLVDKD